MGNGPRLVAAKHFVITVNGNVIGHSNPQFFQWNTGAVFGDFVYPFYIADEQVPDQFIHSYWALLRVFYKLKVANKEDVQKIIDRTGDVAPKMWRTYMQQLLFNKKQEEKQHRIRREKPKTYNPLDKYRSSMKGKFR